MNLPAPKSRHLPALDGVRGIAILLVLATHLVGGGKPAHWGESGAWVSNFLISLNTGVDLFFVLSGFLITGILLDARGSKTYFRNFYVRRALRIFPLYYVAIGLMCIYFWHVGAWAQMEERLPWLLTYCTNIRCWMQGYFDFTVAHVSMDHFWSLGVEEQFYLLWPAAVLFLDGPGLRRLCIACIGIAAVVRLLCVWNNPGGIAALALLPCRMDCFAVGSLIALEFRGVGGQIRRNQRVILIASSLAFVLCCFDQNLYVSFVHATTPWIYGCLIIAAIDARGIQKPLCNPVLRSFGKLSYGIYVLHAPILGMIRLAAPKWSTWEIAMGTLAVTYTASVLSWHLLESPFIRLKAFFPSQRPIISDVSLNSTPAFVVRSAA
ncbi:MAG: acyltransferase [Tepidisphaeraceae bacterium]